MPLPMPRKFAPLAADHPLVTDGTLCAGCSKPFVAGDVTTIVAIGPGDDPEQQQRARQGKVYNAVGAVAHYACVTGEEP